MRITSRNTIVIWTLLLSLAFVSTLAAAEPSRGLSASRRDAAAAEENEISADPLWKYPEPVKVTQVIGYGAPEEPKTPKGTTPATNAYLKKLKEMLNIEVEFLWQVPSDQAQQKFSLAHRVRRPAGNERFQVPDRLCLVFRHHDVFRRRVDSDVHGRQRTPAC